MCTRISILRDFFKKKQFFLKIPVSWFKYKKFLEISISRGKYEKNLEVCALDFILLS